MNHLAHLYLSGTDDHLMAGNFMADHVKGRDLSMYPKSVAYGIRLHRAIDFFTDNHPVVEKSKQRLRPVFHKYAPVVADMYYDHFLAAGWQAYSPDPLPEYATRVYAVLNGQSYLMPVRTQRFLQYMVRCNWLVSYASLEGLHDVLRGMAGRARFDSRMEHATAFLETHYDAFGNEFTRFFPDLRAFVHSFRPKHAR